MSSIERLTITLPADMTALIKNAVAAGEYASTSEIIREALRDWEVKAEVRRRKLEALRAHIDEGIRDADEGRLHEFNLEEIMEMGRQLSRKKSA